MEKSQSDNVAALVDGSHDHISTWTTRSKFSVITMSTSLHVVFNSCLNKPPAYNSTPDNPLNLLYSYLYTINHIQPWILHTTRPTSTHSPMPNPVVFTLCMLAICLPILSVQLPRTTLYTRLRSKPTETRSTGLTEGPPTRGNPAPSETRASSKGSANPAQQQTQQPYRHQETQHQRPKREEEENSEFVRWDDCVAASCGVAGQGRRKESQGLDGTDSGAAEGGAGKEGSVGRKPWEPPFPRRESGRVASWRVLQPVGVGGKSVDGVGDEEGRDKGKGIARVDVDGEKGGQKEMSKPSLQWEKAERDQSSKVGRSRGMRVVWVGAAIMALLLFLLGFAILIAHCLAWFLVYKTEARLGEARRGIMTSGDMRLCLCAA
ncbi:hypothetical protein NX059_009082 [Plenodomus lindquistii]|nr:hypothetical protein NX059_009082 [Plenodomus lindquistii]